jgi:hypothetical protein
VLSALGGVPTCQNPAWGPWINHLVLSPDGQRLYGADVCRDTLLQWNATTLATPSNPTGMNWITQCDGGLQGGIEANGNFYFGGHGNRGSKTGCLTSPGSSTWATRYHLAVFASQNGTLEPTVLKFGSAMGIWSYAVIPQGLLVGGDFAWAGNASTVRQGIALFTGTP